ncbi:TetR/AcrR family transcriptional regulator [Amycolatopsis sp. NPDC059027]|uniref:TetR/AcrR family transcriptional regulator n=1 Tax=unclassified Amycolatopsis TaxID=2618356 RepID=UPI00367079EB
MVTPGGTRPKLSRELIVTKARAIADASGLDALTLRELAHALGTGQASLYRHIADRNELLGLLVDDVALEFPTADPELPPRERLIRVWLDLHAFLSAHQWVAKVIAEGEYVSRNAAPFAGHQLACLTAAGVRPDDALRAYRALYNLLLGFLLNKHPMGHHLEPAGPAPSTEDDEFHWAVTRFLGGLLPAEHPDAP